MSEEQKVVYREYNSDGTFVVRTLRGVVTFEDQWVIVTRRDGVLKLNKQVVDKIEFWAGGEQ